MENLINSFEEACEKAGVDPKSIYNENDTTDEVAYKKLKLVIRVLNDDPAFPNWDDSSQRKWFPWYWMNSPGFRLYDVGFSSSYTSVGSRLCLKSEALVRHLDKHFQSELKSFHTK